MRAPIDDRSPEQREDDEDEEAEMDLNPRQLTQFKVFYRQMSGLNCADRGAGLPDKIKPAVFQRHFEVKTLAKWNKARNITEKPHPVSPLPGAFGCSPTTPTTPITPTTPTTPTTPITPTPAGIQHTGI
jgi:hypothetical protein